jgi:hypothetical protein
MRLLRLATVLVIAFAGNLNPVASATAATTLTAFTADIWADNWFALYVNGVKVAQDPVPITTTKSFNKVSVSFTAKYPLTIALLGRDYTENQTGLEYIGTPQQQIGDAGIIAQIHEKTSGKLVAATSSAWSSYVTNRAPLNADCVSSKQPLVDCKFLTKVALDYFFVQRDWLVKSCRLHRRSSWCERGLQRSFLGFKGQTHLVWQPDTR